MQNKNYEDHVIWKIFDTAKDLILCNLLWVLFSLPILTAGASTAALSAMMQRLLEKKGVSFADFQREFKKNFKYATIGYLVISLLLFVIGFNIYLLPALENPFRSIYAAVCIAAIVLIIFWTEQAVPLLAAAGGDEDVKDIPVTAFVLGIRYFLLTLSSAVVKLAPVWIIIFMPNRFLWLLPVFLTIAVSLMWLFNAYIAGICWKKFRLRLGKKEK